MNKKNNVKDTEQVYPRFISNNPCGEDLFEGKSHETISNCIADQIIAGNNCNIIGIEGSWGSGKSNLVKLINNKLTKEKGKKYFVYTYDVWGYQNDYLRRSVLENLLTFLIKDNEGPKFSKEWNDSLKRLLSRKETIGTRIVKELNFFTKISIYMFLFFELFTFIKDIYFKDFYETQNWFKIVFLISYLVLYIVLLIISWNKNKKKFGETPIPFFQWLSTSFYDFKNDTQNIEDSISSNTVYESEASTREFKDYIKKINKELKDDRLIIVFDNIDRLPVEKVKEVWSMINILFANDDTPNINIIVPFDRAHIISAFKDENIDMLSTQKVNEKIDNKEDITSISYGNDFINKTFNIVFRVSPPTMSNWKTYFSRLWKEAFDETVHPDVLQIYDLLTTDNQTPRKMIAFINEFVSIRKIFGEVLIPEKYIALYIFGKEKIGISPDKEILSPTYLGALDFMYKEDKELPKYVSALYYQLDPENALDIIYTQTIIQSLNNQGTKKLNEIKKLPSFFQLLQNAITKITNLSNTVITLNVCFGEEESTDIQYIWDCVYEQVTLKETELQDYQDILLHKITNKSEYLTTLIEDFSAAEKFDISKYYLSLNHLWKISDIDLEVEDYFIERKVTAEEYIQFVELAKSDYKVYKVYCDEKALDDYLSKTSTESLKTLTALQYLDSEMKEKLSLYKDSVSTKITENNTDKDIVSYLIERLKEIKDPISFNLSDSSIVSLFTKTKQDESFYYDIICMRIARFSAFQGSSSPLYSQIMNNIEDAFVEEITKRIGYYINFSQMIENIERMKNYPLYLAICKELISGTYSPQRASITVLLQNYTSCKNCLQIETESIITKFNTWKQFKNNITIENINTIPIEFFDDGKQSQTEVYKHCVLKAKEYLSIKDKENWKESIVNKDYDYELSLVLSEISENYFEAFKELMQNKAENMSVAFDKSAASNIITICSSNKRSLKTLFNDIRDLFCTGKCTMTNDSFAFFGHWLFEYSDLTKKEEALRRILPTSILNNDYVISEIMIKPDVIKQMIINGNEESQDFKDKLISLHSEKQDPAFSSFIEKVGMELPNEQEDKSKE